MDGVRVPKSNRQPAGSRCSRTPNRVIGSQSPAACTTVAPSASTTVVTPAADHLEAVAVDQHAGVLVEADAEVLGIESDAR